MSKILTYLKYEGLHETVRKCLLAVKNRNKASETVFLKCCEADLTPNPKVKLDVFPLTEDRLQDFEKVKFYEYVSGLSYVNHPKRCVLLGYVDGQIAGYEAIEYHIDREIHGLGVLRLEQDEAWAGPAYVKRAFRGKGINKELIKRAILYGQQEYHIHTVYTCINGENVPSIKAAERIGFRKIGSVIFQNGQYTCRLDGEIAHKFSPLA